MTVSYVTMKIRPDYYKGVGWSVEINRENGLNTYYPGYYSSKRLQTLISSNPYSLYIDLPDMVIDTTFRQYKSY